MEYRNFERQPFWSFSGKSVKKNIQKNEFVKAIRAKLVKKKMSAFLKK